MVIGLALVGAVMQSPPTTPGPGVARLGAAWNTMNSEQGNDVCELIDDRGLKKAARVISRGRGDRENPLSSVGASTRDVEFFLKGLACHIRVQISTGP